MDLLKKYVVRALIIFLFIFCAILFTPPFVKESEVQMEVQVEERIEVKKEEPIKVKKEEPIEEPKEVKKEETLIYPFCPRAKAQVPVRIMTNITRSEHKSLISHWKLKLTDQKVHERMKVCSKDDYLKYSVGAGAGKEKNNHKVPLAFSISVHHQLAILESTLATIVRPHHAICVYVDKKAPQITHDIVDTMLSCFRERVPGSVILKVQDPLSVYWGRDSVLDADLKCLELLTNLTDHNWQYYFNFAGTELPNFTSEEIERKAYYTFNGRNIVHSEKLIDRDRIKLRYDKGGVRSIFQNAWRTIPYNFEIYKGYKNVILTRNFSNFVLHDPVSLELRSFMRNTFIPDEMYIQTLVRVDINKQTKMVTQNRNTVPYCVVGGAVCPRLSVWCYGSCKCNGVAIRNICQFNYFDLEYYASTLRNYIVTNKFNLDIDPFAMACWTEQISKHLPSDYYTS